MSINIALDLDGVLADFWLAFRRRFGRELKFSDGDISDVEWQAINDSDFWLTVPPLPGGRFLAEQSPLPKNFYIVTSRIEATTRDKTLMWLERNGINIPPKRVFFAYPPPTKLMVLERLAPVALIDDYLPTVALADQMPHVAATLLLQPWNAKAASQFPAIATVNSVKAFLSGEGRWRTKT